MVGDAQKGMEGFVLTAPLFWHIEEKQEWPLIDSTTSDRVNPCPPAQSYIRAQNWPAWLTKTSALVYLIMHLFCTYMFWEVQTQVMKDHQGTSSDLSSENVSILVKATPTKRLFCNFKRLLVHTLLGLDFPPPDGGGGIDSPLLTQLLGHVATPGMRYSKERQKS